MLAKLRKLGLVGTMERRIGGIRAGSAGLVHFLTDAGHRLIEGRRRHRVQDPTDRFVEHWLAIADAHCELVVADSREVIGLVESAVEPVSWRRYRGHGGALTTLKPDLYCETATDQDLVHAWFIEVDLGTESIPTLIRKCREYEAYRRSGTEQDRHGAFPLVVWTLTHRDPVKAEQRRRALRAAIDTDSNLPALLFRVIDPQQLIATLQDGGQQ